MANAAKMLSSSFGISDIVSALRCVKLMKTRLHLAKTTKSIHHLSDQVLSNIFSYLKLSDLCRMARVCKRWRHLAYDARLWTRVSLRPEYSGLHVTNADALVGILTIRCGCTLRYLELPAELITPGLLHELASRCPNLRFLTLDFSSAMQLHDYSELNSFPCNLRSLTICLSEVIFMEGFMRKVYQHLSSLQVLHLIGSFEVGEDEQEIFEIINISKIKNFTPNLRVVNLYGIGFVEDTHVDLISSNCIHLECLALNFCLRVEGSSFKVLFQRCRKLKTLLVQHCGLIDSYVKQVVWETSVIEELDLSSTELSRDCLRDALCRMPGFTYLALEYCEFFDDATLLEMVAKGKLDRIRVIDLSYTVSLSEDAILTFIQQNGRCLEALLIAGKPKLIEQFFIQVIPFIPRIRILVFGTSNGWFLRMTTRVHIDQIIIAISQNCPQLTRLEIQWDPDNIRYSDNSSKFIDQLRLKCPHIRCLTLADGEYYEMVKSNFERADRATVVRTTTTYTTSAVSFLFHYKDLTFN